MSFTVQNSKITTFGNMIVAPPSGTSTTSILYSGVGIPNFPSNPPIANTSPGDIYFNTTENALYLADNSLTWNTIDYQGLFQAPNYATAPVPRATGEMYYNTTSNQLFVVVMSPSGAGFVWYALPFNLLQIPNFPGVPLIGISEGQMYFDTTQGQGYIGIDVNDAGTVPVQILNLGNLNPFHAPQYPAGDTPPPAVGNTGAIYYDSNLQTLEVAAIDNVWSPISKSVLAGYVSGYQTSLAGTGGGQDGGGDWLVYSDLPNVSFIPGINTAYYGVGNGYGITCLTAGVALVQYTVSLNPFSTPDTDPVTMGTVIYVNGAPYISPAPSKNYVRATVSQQQFIVISGVWVVSVNPGDYIQLYANNSSAANIDRTNMIGVLRLAMTVTTFE